MNEPNRLTPEQWAMHVKDVDPNFENSFYQKMGLDKELCPTCHAHLKHGICLNGCHLSAEAQTLMQRLYAEFMGDK